MQLEYKVWLEQNGKAFGEGPYNLLLGVSQTGSLRKAASGMGMSYNQAWRLIKKIEDRLGFKLIEPRVGGPSGGGSSVTDQARQIMDSYNSFMVEVQQALKHLFKKHFEAI